MCKWLSVCNMNFRGSIQILSLLVPQSLRQRELATWLQLVSGPAVKGKRIWVEYQSKTKMLLASLSSTFFAFSLIWGSFSLEAHSFHSFSIRSTVTWGTKENNALSCFDYTMAWRPSSELQIEPSACGKIKPSGA